MEPEATKPKHCEICRAPAALMPCSRCVFTKEMSLGRTRAQPRQKRPSQPLLLEDKYRLVAEVGRGGMGTVFKAIDESLDREVAIKFLLPEIQRIPDMVDRFRKEAKAMAAINHENVVKIFSHGRWGRADFLVTEFIEGETLEDTIEAAFQRRTYIEVDRALYMIDQAAAGLSAIHRAGVVHRDVKPGNVMVHEETDRVVIMDFGIGHRPETDKKLKTILPGGTPAYMAPEIIEGGRIDPTKEYLADVYALGVTAFETFTGQLPFDGDNWVKVLQDHLITPPPRPSELRPDLPRDLDEVVIRAMAKEPPQRFQSAAAFRYALLPFLIDYGVVKPQSGMFLPRTVVKETPKSVCEGLLVVVSSADSAFRDLVWKTAKEVTPECQVLSANNNAFAMELLDGRAQKVLIASLDDPRLNGIELAAELLANEDRAGTHLVIAAPSFSASERSLLKRLKVDKLIELPVEPESLNLAFQSLFTRACEQAR